MRCIHKLPNSGTGGTQCLATAVSGSVLCAACKQHAIAAIKPDAIRTGAADGPVSIRPKNEAS